MFNIKLGIYNLWVTTEVFWQGHKPEYFECSLTYSDEYYSYYCHLHKESKITTIDFRFPPDEKKLSAEEFKIKTVEFNSYQNRKDMQMPLWKLHATTVEKLIAEVARLANHE